MCMDCSLPSLCQPPGSTPERKEIALPPLWPPGALSDHLPRMRRPGHFPFGHGTQRVEAALSHRFPHARIMRIDRDSMRRKDAWQKMLKNIQGHRMDILIGTQILAKGHDFPNLSLVCILNSDASLFSYRFSRVGATVCATDASCRTSRTRGYTGRSADPDRIPRITRCTMRYAGTITTSLAQTLLAERKLARIPAFYLSGFIMGRGTKN